MLAATPAAAATFDGDWNVQIASSNAACSSGASVSLGNQQRPGRLEQRDSDGIRRVAEAGNISVTLTSGMKRASAPVASRHLRLRHLARRVVFGHLDSAAELASRPESGNFRNVSVSRRKATVSCPASRMANPL